MGDAKTNLIILRQDVPQITVSLVAATIPLSITLGNAALISAAAIALFWGITYGVRIDRILKFPFLIPALFFFFILTSALFSNDLAAGLKQVDKALLIVLITAVFLIFHQTKGICVRRTLTVFAASGFFTSCIYFISGFWSIYAGGDFDGMFFHNFSAFFDQHAVYVALYNAVGVFVLTRYYLLDKAKFHYRIVSLMAIVVLVAGLLFTASKAVLAIFGLLYPIQIIVGAKSASLRLLALVLLAGIAFLIFNTPIVRERFEKGLEFNMGAFEPTEDLTHAKVFTNDEKRAISDLEIRYIMARIGLYHSLNDGVYWFGYGIGDVQHYVDYYYMFYGLAPRWFEGYNVHNQYLQIFISMGIFALLLFLYYLGHSFWTAIKHRDALHILFLVSIIFVCVFECLLSRNKGIIFFFFINTLFLLKTYPIESCDPGNERHS